MPTYVTQRELPATLRVPLHCSIDLTYRCNNNCRHCWLWLPANAPEEKQELTFDEIRRIADEARALGTREWQISGGEPMLRPDFTEIFDYLTRRSAGYVLNTNGTLITPQIADLMKRGGSNLVALYGADAKVHDAVTRVPGSFEALMRGVSLLRAAGAPFIVQVVPMKRSCKQYHKMIELALSLSPHWRLGAAWFYLSASGDPRKNREIMEERLTPQEVVALEGPTSDTIEWLEEEQAAACHRRGEAGGIFAPCVQSRDSFHIDPYGGMTFCEFIKDPSLRYDLRHGNVRTAWEYFIPSLAERGCDGGKSERECDNCEWRIGCRWCPAYAYLENRRFTGRIQYHCDLAQEECRARDAWVKEHRRYFQIAGLTLQVESDRPITNNTFHAKFGAFQADRAGTEIIRIRHHFHLPKLEETMLEKPVYCRPPWSIYRRGRSWIYLNISDLPALANVVKIVVANDDHSRIRVYHSGDFQFQRGGMYSLTGVSTDQVLLAPALANRQGCFIHSSGVVLDGRGYLFVGHSEAGKSTISRMMMAAGGQLLCDDRNIIRRHPEGFFVHGTWNHGELPQVSGASAPLHGIYFLEKSAENRLSPMTDRGEVVRQLLPRIIRSWTSADWWDKTIELLTATSAAVPAWTLRFDLSGAVVPLLRACPGRSNG